MDNPSYFQRRMEEELSAAERAGDPGIAMIHRDMAARYCQLLIREAVDNGDRRRQPKLPLIAEAQPVLA